MTQKKNNDLNELVYRVLKNHVELVAQLKFLKARPVSYAITGKIEVETKRLQDEGTIEPVQFLEQTAPIVPILNPDNSVHTYIHVDD